MSFNRSGYIGRAPGDSSIVLAKQYFQPTGAGKTFTFDAGYNPGLIDVYRNGVKLINVLDYTATNGTSIVLTQGTTVDDVIEIVAFNFNSTGPISSGLWENNNTGINTSTNIGIGTTTASSELTVSGDARITGIVTAENGFTSGTGTAVQINVVGSTLTFTVAGIGSTSLTLS